MNPEIVFREWTGDSIWSPWVKPVLFAHLASSMIVSESLAAADAAKTDLSHVHRATGTAAIVVDLPGAASISTGLALAELGYRPIPLYNSVPVILPASLPSLPTAPNLTPATAQENLDLAVSLVLRDDESTRGPRAVIDMTPVVRLLVQGAENLSFGTLSPHAPPAFLLDSRRRGIGTICRPGDFDNRSISLPTDFPSANFMLSNRIRDIIVIQEHEGPVEQDLAHTLRRWQEAGIRILTSTPGTAPQSVVIPRPPRFRHMWYGLLARLGLRQNTLGGFGGFLPLASAG